MSFWSSSSCVSVVFFCQAFIPLVPGINLPWYLATSLAIVSSTGPWWRISHSGWLDGPGGAQSSADAAACKVFFLQKTKGGDLLAETKAMKRCLLKVCIAWIECATLVGINSDKSFKEYTMPVLFGRLCAEEINQIWTHANTVSGKQLLSSARYNLSTHSSFD